MSSRAQITVLLLWIAGCGTAPEEEDPLVFQEKGRCLSCNVTLPPDEELPQPTGQLSVSPTELMFYDFTFSTPRHPAQQVQVHNTLPTMVVLLDAYVVENPSLGESGDEGFFVVEWFERQTLQPGERAAVKVRFLGSEHQRFATLHIRTTAPDYALLTVLLTGKTFYEL